MSYDIDLIDQETKKPAAVENHEEGGTYAIGGIKEASLNITYNYSKSFYEHLDTEQGIRWLYGKTGKETEQRLASAVAILGTERHDNYWEPTPGNAGYALSILLKWARQHPTAVFEGD
jgi:hypothetical protein